MTDTRLDTIESALDDFREGKFVIVVDDEDRENEGDDRRIREISVELEAVIEDLSNTRDKVILTELNRYPIMATHAHTRPFRNKWLNATVGILLPLGVFFYLRMLRFRLRLLRDLRVVRAANDALVARIAEMDNGNAGRH